MADLALFKFTRKNDLAKSLFSGWKLSKGKTANALAGNDVISGGSNLSNTSGVRIDRKAKLIGGLGNDTIAGSSDAAFGIINGGLILAEDGNDRIGGRSLGSSGNEGVYNYEAINTGDGNDSITGRSQNDDGIHNDGVIKVGDDDDSITGRSLGLADFPAEGIDNYGVIDTEAGDDSILGRSASSAGLYNEKVIKTGDGNDVITGIGSTGVAGIVNLGKIIAGSGDDKVNAKAGGFGGNGTTDLGSGNDALIGFGTGKFIGGKGTDKILLGDGVYRIEGGLIALASGGSFMKTNSFEKIGGVDGGLFNFADGLLTVTGGVATSLV
jgi:hypothetical protein